MTNAISLKRDDSTLRSEARAAIVRMLTGLGERSANPDVVAANYLFAARGLPLDAVTKAADRFQTGRVPGQNLRFPPNTAEFCAEVRQTQSDLFPAIAPPTGRAEPEERIDPAMRARVGAKMEAFAKKLKMGLEQKRANEREARKPTRNWLADREEEARRAERVAAGMPADAPISPELQAWAENQRPFSEADEA